MVNPVDLDDRVQVAARVVAGKLAEGPLDLALPPEDAGLQHVLRSPRKIQTGRHAHDPVRAALYRCGHLVLELRVEHGRRSAEGQQRVVADRYRDGQVLSACLGVGEVGGDVGLGDRLYGEGVGAFHLDAVDADVLDIVVVRVVGITADHACLVDEVGAVAAVEAAQRHEIVEVDVVIDDVLLPRCL